MPHHTTEKAIEFSLEVFPPKLDERIADLCKVVSTYQKYEPQFVSITEKSGNDSNLTLMRTLLSQTPVPLAAHFIAWNKSPEQANELADIYWQMGVKKILALRGDPIEGQAQPKHFLHAVDLVKTLKKRYDFEILVAAYPEKHPNARSLEEDIYYLKMKQDAGASIAITQFFFDPEIFLRFRDMAVKQGVTLSLVPGIIPILNFENICKMATRCEANVPDFLHKMFENESPELLNQRLLAMNVLTHQVTRLISEDIKTFHFYTLNELTMVRQLCQWMRVAF